jgi:hypothetical protein
VEKIGVRASERFKINVALLGVNMQRVQNDNIVAVLARTAEAKFKRHVVAVTRVSMQRVQNGNFVAQKKTNVAMGRQMRGQKQAPSLP